MLYNMGTKVTNPMRRSGSLGWYKICLHCGKAFTHLGLPRHWDKCAKKLEKEQQKCLPFK